MIFRRSPASSSFVLAAARLRALQLDPGRAAAGPGQLRGRIQKNSQSSPAAHGVTGLGPYALLTTVALMGADERVSGIARHYGRVLEGDIGEVAIRRLEEAVRRLREVTAGPGTARAQS